jgi:LysM repeat protein
MTSHSRKTFVQNTTFLGSICRPLVIIGLLTGYSFSYLLSVSAEVISNHLKPSVVSLKVSPTVGAKLHQVQAGDTLCSLTQMYQVDAAALAISNRIRAATPLPIGSQLVIPPVDSIVYKVQLLNDTLSQVASLYQVPQAQIAKASGLLNPAPIRIEQPLVIPRDVKRLLSRREEKTVSNITEPHLHFEIIPRSGVVVDPISYLVKR